MRTMIRTATITGASKLLRLLVRPRRGNDSQPLVDPRRILLLKPCCLGDVLLTTPLLEAVRRGFPSAEITYAVGQWSRPMVETSRHVDNVLVVPDQWTPGSMLVVARDLRQRHFDLAFVPERSPLPALLTLLAGIPTRVGLDSRGRGFAYTHPVPVAQTVVHEADIYLLLARSVGLMEGERRLWFFPSTTDRSDATSLLDALRGEGPLVVLHPGGGSNPGMVLERKRWLPGRWAMVADALNAELGTRTLIVGSAAEAALAETVRAAMHTPATIVTQQWRWGMLAAVIESAALFLGHDTGMSLLANAVGTPHVVVFGPSDPQMYGPYGLHGRCVWRPSVESPCFYDGSAPERCACAGQCMRNIEVDDVFRVARALLHERADKAGR